MYDALDEGSAASRLRFHVTRAVHHDGLLPVLRLALLAWWNRPRLPDHLDDRLRADMGLPPARKPSYWLEPPPDPQVPPPIWRPGL